MRVWVAREHQQVLPVSQIESLLLSRFVVSSVHPFPLSSVVDAMSASPAWLAPSVPHSFHGSSCSHTCVSKSTSAPHSQSKKDSLLSSLPPSLFTQFYFLTRQWHSLSLSATCSLARSLTVSRPQQTVCPQTAADSGSAELQGCLLCLSFLGFHATTALPLSA